MNVIFIPVRGGSKSIKMKNVKTINHKPLIYWALKASLNCKYSDKVYVSTDNMQIMNVVKNLKNELELYDNIDKLEIINRSLETATDEATTESAMLEFANKYDFTNICLVQVTSPLLSEDDLNRGFQIFLNEKVDSVFSAVKQKRFNWDINSDGYAIPINYDYKNRPRRQDFNGYYVENGAFYITSKRNLLKTNNRISGKIKIVEMNENSYYEIDEINDFYIIESLMKLRRDNNKGINFDNIKIVLSDVDGCLTDGGMYYSEKGDELKKFNAKDGMAFQMLKEKKYIIGIVTSEKVKLNIKRAKKLNFDICEINVENKLNAIKRICNKYNVKLENVLYIGDDINDFQVLKEVGIGCCPKDAVESIKNICDLVLDVNGGRGVIRAVLDLLENYGK